MLYVRNDIPSKIISTSFPPHIECFFVEINLRKKKWLLCCSYNPQKSCIENHLECLSKELDLKSVNYENLLIFGDFNSEPSEDCMKQYIGTYNLHSLISVPTCFKNPENPSCIDLILTNRPTSFQNTTVMETGISDFHKLTFTVMKMNFPKKKTIVIRYRSYKKLNNQIFQTELYNELRANRDIISYYQFHKIFMELLDRHIPPKKRYIRANSAPYMNNVLNHAVMLRTRLRNKYLRNKNEASKKAYNRQRNYCVSLFRKERRKYYENLNVKCITDNKKFWRTVKPFFSDKKSPVSSIMLKEKDAIICQDEKCAEILTHILLT